jgi:5-formyltetrahydrofolate cyclo-ligase
MTTDGIAQRKQAIRRQVWDLLEQHGAAPPGVHGHIPDFVGAGAAAQQLTTLPEWQQARVIMANPDRAQLPVRVAALDAGRLVYMAVPRLAGPKPFYRLDPSELNVPYDEAATGDGAARHAPTVDVNANEMEPVDLIVCGSVAVNNNGARLGKGAGYTDIETRIVADAGLVQPGGLLTTTVHQLQLINNVLPEAEHDFRVNVIASPNKVVRVARGAP